MDREWRIDELAAATGLSVRALRHYEQIGLLWPTRHTTTRGGRASPSLSTPSAPTLQRSAR